MDTSKRSPSLQKYTIRRQKADIDDAMISEQSLFGDADLALDMDSALADDPMLENAFATTEEDRTEWPVVYGARKDTDKISNDPPPSFLNKLETGVKNGDCLLACFAVLLECLYKGCISPAPLQREAAHMRTTLVAYIIKNWDAFPIFNQSMKVHEMITLTHDVPEERRNGASWGETSQEQLKAYNRLCHHVYCSDVEMLLFSSMMYEKGIPIVFRTWRWRSSLKKSELVSTIPERMYLDMHGIRDVYVVDLEHSGSPDGRSAHYKIIDGGSLLGLLELASDSPRSRHATTSEKAKKSDAKRRRLVKLSSL
tara:strand:- start:4677 stop:5609 length:933 start_codon:yes stop_codon:yes gene_type:complete